MLDGAHLRVLHTHGFSERDKRLAGRIGDHVQVKRALLDIHV